MAEIHQLRNEHSQEVIELQEKIKKLEISRHENISLILQKESSIRLL